ncbi:MAG TPA: hypothetical protein VJY33_16110 [Isosphaeraceae bacterium]|nr:hypothetical protein [Isosphaeraceae bacterium]
MSRPIVSSAKDGVYSVQSSPDRGGHYGRRERSEQSTGRMFETAVFHQSPQRCPTQASEDRSDLSTVFDKLLKLLDQSDG